MLRVALALARVVPRYWLLLARDRSGSRPTSDADWQRVHRIAAREIKNVALSLAGAFTKAAQILGARADIFPAPFIEELSQFHDAVPPRRFETLAPLVLRDLGRPLDAVFASIEHQALAAASLAQVHRATLRDGSQVVLKIRYPEITRVIPLDLGMLRRVVAVVQRLQRRIDLRALVTEVTRFNELELDFPREARSTERIAKQLVDLPWVVVPHVYTELCGENTLVLEYLEGIQIGHTEELVAAGHKLPEIARRIGALYGTMIFEQGFFHGDPHPGNLLVMKDGRIALLDFGLAKELPPGFARKIATMMVSSMIGDSGAALAAAKELGFDVGAMRPENLRTLMLMMVGDSDTDASFFDIVGETHLERIPEDFALVGRTLILLNGLSHRLAPGRRLVQAELLKHLAAGAARGPA
jgi:ubiquinone biosynthesis protein